MSDYTLVKAGRTEDCMDVYMQDGNFFAKNGFLEEYVPLGTEVNVEEVSSSRDYQVTTVVEAVDHLRDGFTRLAIVLATGAGKTWTTRQLLSFPALRKELGVTDRPLKVLFVAGKKRLLQQAQDTFGDLPDTELHFLSALARGVPKEAVDFDVAIYDEGQHEAMASWNANLRDIGRKPIIYLTATPDRADGRLLKVDKEINTISRESLEDRGLLSRVGVFSLLDANLTKDERSDFLLEYFEEYQEEFGQTLITVQTQNEARKIHSYLTSIQVASGLVVSVTDAQVQNLLEQFERKELKVLVNCNKLNEGIDVKGLTDIILGRQFSSEGDLNQNVGRVVRPDSEARVHQFINPGKKTLDTMDIVGRADFHILRDRRSGDWREVNMSK